MSINSSNSVNTIDFLELFIQNSVDLNYQDSYGNTLLHYALFENNFNLIDFLIVNGAKTDLKNNLNRSVDDLKLTYIIIYLNKISKVYMKKLNMLLISKMLDD